MPRFENLIKFAKEILYRKRDDGLYDVYIIAQYADQNNPDDIRMCEFGMVVRELPDITPVIQEDGTLYTIKISE